MNRWMTGNLQNQNLGRKGGFRRERNQESLGVEEGGLPEQSFRAGLCGWLDSSISVLAALDPSQLLEKEKLSGFA